MSILIMLVLLGILILVHEAGHFFTAKYFGIKVDKFGFGLPIGPTLYKTKWGETEILIHAFLLGGYISFPEDEADCELPKDSPERFTNKPMYQRAAVISAGVTANILIAFILVFLTAAMWGKLPSGQYAVYVNDFSQPLSNAVKLSGLQKNDQIVEINGSKITNTYALLSFVKLSKSYDGKTDEKLIRDNYLKLKTLNPVFSENEIIPPNVAVRLPEYMSEASIRLDEKVLKGLKYYKDNEVKLSENQIKLRDEIKNKTVYVSDGSYSLNDIAHALSDNSHPLSIKVKRGKDIVQLNTINVDESGQIGIKLEAREFLHKTSTPAEIIKFSTKYLWDNTYSLVYGLWQIFTGQIPLKHLHGIVVITKVGGDIIENSGIFSGLLLTAVISMNLAIVNFLPIPALDGGHIFFMILEKIRGKKVNEEILEKVSGICFMLLILLMIFVIFNDIFALVTKKF